MNDMGLQVTLRLALTWRPSPNTLDPARTRGNVLLLRALNAIESSPMDRETDPMRERLETKLDLALHWLAHTLFAIPSDQERSEVRLEQESITWRAGVDAPALGARVLLTLAPGGGPPAPLVLDAEIVEVDGPWHKARLIDSDPAWRDAWMQWLFRQHRRAIQAARAATDH
jgi:hypothetical protein